MAQFSFQVKSIKANLAMQSVFIECTLDVDIDSIDAGAIYIIKKADYQLTPFTIDVDRNVIQIKLQTWAAPNEKYTLIINGNIASIVGDTLNMAIHQDVWFKSEVDSRCEILSPANFAVVSDVPTLAWKEKHPENQQVGKFYVEVATDPGFNNLICKSFIPAPTPVKRGESIHGQ